jgi:pteridine reductase
MKAATGGACALITGGGVRLGRFVTEALAREGYDVLIHYASSEAGAREARESARAQGVRAEVFGADLTDRGAIQALEGAARAFGAGKLDLLVHNAANFERTPPASLDAGAWDRAMALNATAPYLLTLGLRAELCAARGSVVAIGCVSAARPWKNYVPYSASKAALVHVMQGLALALAPEVRVNVVSPGTVLPPAHYDEAALARIREKIPLGRIGDAESVIRAVMFFASNEFVTGQVLAVDGGRSLV